VRIFLDVGAHEGQTLEEVVCGTYAFDLVYAFEPMPEQFARLEETYGNMPGVILCNYGLSDVTGEVAVYGNNENFGASIFPLKIDVDGSVSTLCQMVSASQFFAENLPDGATVVMKLNCEGAEVPIIADLINSGEIERVSNMMIDFDVRKIPNMRLSEGSILRRLRFINFDRFMLCEWVMVGETHRKRIANWLHQLQHLGVVA
jgi:FkbM family methyltransferase